MRKQERRIRLYASEFFRVHSAVREGFHVPLSLAEVMKEVKVLLRRMGEIFREGEEM